jgi:hypothetical protein
MKTGYLPAALAGLVLWLLTSGASGQREPWDAPEFWTLGYPVAIGVSALLGLVWPRQSWSWGFIVMAMMAPAMALNGSDLSLLPLGLVALAVLAVPPCIAGLIAGRFRRAVSRA